MDNQDQKKPVIDAGGPKRQPPVIDAKAVPSPTSAGPESKVAGAPPSTVRPAVIPPRPAPVAPAAQASKPEPAKESEAAPAPAKPTKAAKARPHYAYVILLGALTAFAGSVALHMLQDPQQDVVTLKAKVASIQAQLGKVADESAKSRLGVASDQARLAQLSEDMAKLAGPKSATTLTKNAASDLVQPAPAGAPDQQSAAPATPQAKLPTGTANAAGSTSATTNTQSTASDLAQPTTAPANVPAQQSAASVTALAALSASMATLQGKVATLDQSMPKVNAALAANQSAIQDNKAQIAAAMATPQGAALAVVSQSIAAALQQNRSFPIEVKALQGLHVDPNLLAPLAKIADKGPVATSALATSFAPILEAITKAETPVTPAPQGMMGWIGAKAASLVQVRDTRLPVGDAPGAAAAKIEVALQQGNAALALKDWDALPDSAKKLSADWVAPLQQRVASEASVQKLSETALAAMTSQMAHSQ